MTERQVGRDELIRNLEVLGFPTYDFHVLFGVDIGTALDKFEFSTRLSDGLDFGKPARIGIIRAFVPDQEVEIGYTLGAWHVTQCIRNLCGECLLIWELKWGGSQ